MITMEVNRKSVYKEPDEVLNTIMELINYARERLLIPLKIMINPDTYQILKEKVSIKDEVYLIHGVKIVVLTKQPEDTLTLVTKDRHDDTTTIKYKRACIGKGNPDLPEKYIVNDGATILFWDDDTKTIVKKSKKDIFDPIKSYLWAYFLKHCGMSRTQANKYLAKINEEN